MARIVKRKNKRKKFSFVAKMSLVVISLALTHFATNLFYNTRNNELVMKIQKMNDELAVLTNENKDLNNEIQLLENKDRVYVIAQAANLNQQEGNIISIAGE